MNSRRVLVIFVLILASGFTAQAQSGRRQPKTVPAAPVPTPTPEPTPIPVEKKESDIAFFVGANNFSSYGSIPLAYYDAAVRGCADRLREASSADVDMTEKDLSRGEAIKKAKSESKTFVVVLSLSFDAFSRSYDDLQLDYVVFAPTTAKVAASGRTYLAGGRAGPIVVGPTGAPGGLFRERLLRQAGEEAAKRILKAVFK